MDNLIKQKLNTYPENIQTIFIELRAAIFEIAANQNLGQVRESLKWSQLSYVCNQGTAVRFDWSENTPKQFSIYVNCQTMLIETFKEIYGDTIQFVGNREMIFAVDSSIPWLKLKHCFSMALRYHRIMHLPMLGE